jgi:hypothetical protein
LLGVASARTSRAVEAINVRIDASAIDLTEAVERIKSEGDRIQVSTAPGADGIIRRIEVRSREAGQNWVVFALANNSDEQIDRLIVAPHCRMVDSGPGGWTSPAHGQYHAEPDRPDWQDSPSADISASRSIGTIITYVVELRSDQLPQLYLWEPTPTRTRSTRSRSTTARDRHRRLARAVPHHPVRREGQRDVPGGGRAGWAVLVYIGTDWFWGKVFDLSAGTERSGARERRSPRRRWSCSCSPISISTAGMCAMRISPPAGWCFSARSPRSRCSIRRSPGVARLSLAIVASRL